MASLLAQPTGSGDTWVIKSMPAANKSVSVEPFYPSAKTSRAVISDETEQACGECPRSATAWLDMDAGHALREEINELRRSTRTKATTENTGSVRFGCSPQFARAA
jgi:hypothetical protein